MPLHVQAQGSAGGGANDLEEQGRPVLDHINRERAVAGQSPAVKLTVPLLKEHLRGKLLSGVPWRAGAKKREELIADFRWGRSVYMCCVSMQ